MLIDIPYPFPSRGRGRGRGTWRQGYQVKKLVPRVVLTLQTVALQYQYSTLSVLSNIAKLESNNYINTTFNACTTKLVQEEQRVDHEFKGFERKGISLQSP
jgi:hypothetical protein